VEIVRHEVGEYRRGGGRSGEWKPVDEALMDRGWTHPKVPSWPPCMCGGESDKIPDH